ncbi:MAG TPA: HRDC domain-containing protein [Pyrinomonadaceae bacterium]|nr:HRDC domain-containing protein [Pyrinomonadaceae bacterium]
MHDAAATNGTRFSFLDDADRVRAAVARFQSESVVALDTETYWDTASKCARLSLAQLAAPQCETVVIDVLAVGAELLRPLVESPAVSMVAHNARFDEGVLVGAGLHPVGFIDTLRLARLALNLDSYSLASVTEHLLGLPLDKTLQNSNWRRRPLTKAQLLYAATDARITLEVYETLRTRLAEQGRLDDAMHYATLAPAVERERRKPRRRRTVEVPREPLTEEQKKVVAHLKRWRMRRSVQERVPAYMVCNDKTLEHLARACPLTLEDLTGIYGLGESKIARFGEELLEALQEASK